MSAHPRLADGQPRLEVTYVRTGLSGLLDDPTVLAVLGFGPDAPAHGDPRYLRLGLHPLGDAPFEVWRTGGHVQHGREGALAWAADGALMFGAIELDEALVDGSGDIESAAFEAYRRLEASIRARGYPHLLRTWNYLADITGGDGDEERYRRFCVGRARGISTVEGALRTGKLPAATAIGRTDGAHRLQVYWLAARLPGTPLENPRQVSAYRYPRQYGPQPPSFARAMLPPAGSDMPLLLSGTAAVVGHETRHPGSVRDQFDETLANFDSLLSAARAVSPGLPADFGRGTHLKVYVRDAEELETVAGLLDTRFGDRVPRLLLHAAICRRDLRMEIDGVHGP